MLFWDRCGCSAAISAGWTRNLYCLPDRRLSETRSAWSAAKTTSRSLEYGMPASIAVCTKQPSVQSADIPDRRPDLVGSSHGQNLLADGAHCCPRGFLWLPCYCPPSVGLST